jgi:NAD(P)-dependent dehydrogenase (short-subunit alcohol dehydrogenase family)
MELGLSGRRALVTGSYRGTGAGIARMLAAEGAHVLVHGFEPGQADEVVAQITSSGGAAEPVVVDIADADEVAAAPAAWFDVDVLVNNYGTPVGSSWSSVDDWTAEWQANVELGVRVAQRCLPGMRDRGWGRVVFVGTVGVRRPGSRNPGYYAAKAALPSVVRTLAMELRGSGVTANLVSPGLIATAEILDSALRRVRRDDPEATADDAERWVLTEWMPNLTERIPTPDDIGRVVAFVAGDAAWHITGADLAVDGGALDA